MKFKLNFRGIEDHLCLQTNDLDKLSKIYYCCVEAKKSLVVGTGKCMTMF